MENGEILYEKNKMKLARVDMLNGIDFNTTLTNTDYDTMKIHYHTETGEISGELDHLEDGLHSEFAVARNPDGTIRFRPYNNENNKVVRFRSGKREVEDFGSKPGDLVLEDHIKRYNEWVKEE